MTMPKVTVFIPLYNRKHYICDAINSILSQSLTDFELLVIDDGSTDGSVEKLFAYKDPRLRILCNEHNMGIPATRNRGIKEARGEYLAFLDSDDRATPGRLARQVAFLDQHPEYAAVGGWIAWMDDQGRSLGRIKRKAVAADDIAAQRLFRSCLENTASMARTAVLRTYGHREDFALGSDYDLWARIAVDWKLAALPEVVVYRRAHSGRTTEGQAMRIKQWRLKIYAWQLEALGVSFTADDLERHYLLRRMQKVGFQPDPDFLDWTEDWLLGLQSANQRTRLYPEPAFTSVLAEFWMKTWWHTAARGRYWLHFWRSPLRKLVWQSVFHSLRRHTVAGLPRTAWP